MYDEHLIIMHTGRLKVSKARLKSLVNRARERIHFVVIYSSLRLKIWRISRRQMKNEKVAST